MLRSLVVLLVVSFVATSAQARDWYVSKARGKGKSGTKEKPAKDLGNIASRLAAGDVVHIAAGTYLGKGENGADEINVPVSIVGGYDETFTKQDPWGAHRTILTGNNKTKNYKVSPRLFLNLSKYRGQEMPAILIEGLIIDQASQNRYRSPKRHVLVRKANPKTGENPTPDRGGLVISLSKTGNLNGSWSVTVKNNVVMNSAPTQGCLQVAAYKGSKVIIGNNLVINCTGTGIYAATSYHGSSAMPTFHVLLNTVLFTWKYDAYVQSFSGNGMKIDDDVLAKVENNVIGFSDRFNVMKKGKEPLVLKSNGLIGAIDATYYEASGDQKILFADLEDEAEYLTDTSGDNLQGRLAIPVSKTWKSLYGQRVLIDRNAAEADISPQRTRANAVRSILGLNQRADDLKADSPVWLHPMSVDEALAVGKKRIAGGAGCQAP